MYPEGIQVFIDDVDVTAWIFGIDTDTLTLTNVENTWRGIDITGYLGAPGLHQIRVTALNGVGRVEARVELE